MFLQGVKRALAYSDVSLTCFLADFKLKYVIEIQTLRKLRAITPFILRLAAMNVDLPTFTSFFRFTYITSPIYGNRSYNPSKCGVCTSNAAIGGNSRDQYSGSANSKKELEGTRTRTPRWTW